MLEDERHVTDLISAYVLGALEPEEIEAVELHLLDCPACQQLVEEERAVVQLLPYLAEPQPVPARAREELLRRVERAPVSITSHGRLRSAVARLGWVAAVAAVFVAGILALNGQRMQAEFEQKDQQLTAAQESQRTVASFFSSPRGFVTALQSTGVAPGAEGGVILDPTRNAAFLMVEGLPKAPTGQAYVVWLLRGTEHVNAGILPVDDLGRGTLYIAPPEAISSYDGILITEESGPLATNPKGVRMMAARVEP